MLLTVVVYWFLPDFPETAQFLNKEERELAVLRLRIDAGPATKTGFSWKQFRMVFKDWKVYLHMLTYICGTIPMYSMALFMPSIINEFNLE